ncbi:unnamed protein product [Penicillium nalgiovense]|uniref:Uncharacterized protein n=1 Tax=Penicillium nalgiovense TaxID=60175 RepID=A0A9W4IJT3_PENNA|nr:unnamed protein product [Penicillium nalgiovense]CAG8000727.1 unnamed protein product [Penicillium nalgiovense]CAG8030695.1 unnamed protein product [Penicillium nalgiovense]CAG8061133.1 unnamed protein product [Penicillium nalgiovense]CAG8081501.1 unnamed protein product [Penicillium nalgiovense]
MGKIKIPKGFKVWYENLLTIAQKSPDVPPPLLQHISKLESTQLPTIAASDMSLQQTEMAFGIKQATGTQPWMVPHLFFTLPADFGRFLELYDTLTKSGVRNEAKSRCRIDALIFVVYRSLSEQDLLPNTGDSRATLSFETPFKWSPVPVNGVPHTCTGTADYTVLFGGRDHMACHMIVLEAKKRDNLSGAGQLLAYMAMVQANRKARGQSNWSVWGCLSDGWDFNFYFLDLEGNWSSKMLSSAVWGWQEIANTLAHMIIQAQAVANSPLRLSLCSAQGPATRPSSVVSSVVKGSIALERKSASETAEPPAKRQRTSIGGSSALEAPGSVTSEVPSIGSLEIRLNEFLKESEAGLDRIAESD